MSDGMLNTHTRAILVWDSVYLNMWIYAWIKCARRNFSEKKNEKKSWWRRSWNHKQNIIWILTETHTQHSLECITYHHRLARWMRQRMAENMKSNGSHFIHFLNVDTSQSALQEALLRLKQLRIVSIQNIFVFIFFCIFFLPWPGGDVKWNVGRVVVLRISQPDWHMFETVNCVVRESEISERKLKRSRSITWPIHNSRNLNCGYTSDGFLFLWQFASRWQCRFAWPFLMLEFSVSFSAVMGLQNR